MSAAAIPFADPFAPSANDEQHKANVVAFPGSKLEQALQLARMGFYVIQLPPNQKKPPCETGWQTWATRDEDKIRAAWTTRPNRNIGISTSRFGDDRALLVVDVDVRDGKPGEASLTTLQAEYGALPETLTVRTPTGGTHYFLVVDHAVKQDAGKLGVGLDTRSQGGYVVAAGSTTKDGTYAFVDASVQIASAPNWLIEKCGQPRVKDANASKPVEGIDRDAARARVIHYLQHEAPIAIEGRAGDEQTFKTAARCKDLGATEAECNELMWEIYNPRCEPPWAPEDLAKKVCNAYAYGTEAPGASAPEAVFPAVPGGEQKPNRFTPIAAAAFMAAGKPLQWWIKGVIPKADIGTIYGQWSAGKSFFALDMAVAIAAGAGKWFDRKVVGGRVCYLVAEGAPGLRGRLKAIAKERRVDLSGLDVIECPPDLMKLDDAKALAAAIKAAGNYDLLFIDTLAQSTTGDENSAKDMSVVIRHCRAIRHATGTMVVLIHHSGKDGSKGPRGSSSFPGAMDVSIEITRKGDNRTAIVAKMKDGGDTDRFDFRLKVVELDERDDDGDAITSCVVVESGRSAEEAFKPKAPLKPDTVLCKALQTLQDLSMGGSSVPVAKWQEEFRRVHYPKSKRKDVGDTFRRAKETLRNDQWVTIENDHAFVSE